MTKNPFFNALAALTYIVMISLVLNYGAKIEMGGNDLVVPIAMVSLFTLSAAVMGYVFLSQPAQLYFADKKQPAVKLFLQTVATFGLMTVLIFLLLFTGVFAG